MVGPSGILAVALQWRPSPGIKGVLSARLWYRPRHILPVNVFTPLRLWRSGSLELAGVVVGDQGEKAAVMFEAEISGVEAVLGLRGDGYIYSDHVLEACQW